MTGRGWSPEIDAQRPNAARVYDYYLGGSHNFAVDREMAEQAIALWPELPVLIHANRSFLRRAVKFLVGQGIRQFLDLGSGIPTVGNVHEIAQGEAPESRVVYVDTDPVAVAYSRHLLEGNSTAATIQADLRQPGQVLDDPVIGDLLDLAKPVAVLMVAVLHFVPDSDSPAGIVARYRHVMAPGSYLVLSHASQVGQQEKAALHEKLYSRTTTPMTMRTPDEISEFMRGFDLVAPGLVHPAQWRPDPGDEVPEDPAKLVGYAAVGRREWLG